MAVSHTPTFVQTPKTTPMSFVNADSTTKKTVATAGADGSKVTAVNVSNTDTIAQVMKLWLTRSATSYLLNSYSVPAGAGSDGATPVASLFTGLSLPVDNDGQKYLFLESGDTLQVSAAVAITAAKEVDAVAVFGNF